MTHETQMTIPGTSDSRRLSRTFSTAVSIALLALGLQHDALSASITITVEATIVPTVKASAQNGIVFGEISASAIPGSVLVSTNGSRTTTGGTSVNSSTSGSPAQFEISGEPNATYTITLPSSVVITSATGDTMTVNNFSSNPPSSGQLKEDGKLNMNVGGRLNVNGFQPFGSYTGVMTATVEYN